MNSAQWHLLLNHLPVLLPMVGVIAVGVGFFQRSIEVRKLGLWFLVVSALAAIPTYLSGGSAESVVKNYPNVSRSVIHRHEEAAETAFIVLQVLGAASLMGIVVLARGKSLPKIYWAAEFILAIVVFVLMAWAAHLGGEIRHEEIRPMDFTQQ